MTGKERLRVLAEHLATVPAERFRMDVWTEEPSGCGTVGCAVGHGMDNPVLQAEGLAGSSMGYPTIRGAGWCLGMEAVEVFFELDREDANWLFHEEYYDEDPITPQHVIDRINGYLSY